MKGLYIIWFGTNWTASSWESKSGEGLKDALRAAADWQDRWDEGRKVISDIIYLSEDKEVVFSKPRLDVATKYYESLFPEDGYYERARPSGRPIYNV